MKVEEGEGPQQWELMGKSTLFSFCASLFPSISHCGCCVCPQAGKKAVRAVLWVSADGLRVVDDKTKVLKDSKLTCDDPPDTHSVDKYSTFNHNEVWDLECLKE